MIRIIINSLGKGGAERSVLTLLKELIQKEIKVEVICLFADRDSYEIDYELKDHVKLLNSSSFVTAQWNLLRYLLSRRDGFIFSLLPQSNLSAIWVGMLLGIRVITSERTTPTHFYKTRLKLALALLPHALSNKAVFISNYAVTHGLPPNLLGRLVSRNSAVVHNPVVVSISFSQSIINRQIRVGNIRDFINNCSVSPLKVLIASRLIRMKGILEFLESNAEFILRSNMHIYIAGAGPLDGEIRDLVYKRNISSKVTFLGFVTDMEECYKKADLVVLTSETEGFGRVGFEAYMHGCLVIGTSRNSFWSEIIDQAPAWSISDNLVNFGYSVKHLYYSICDNQFVINVGCDMKDMKAALSVESHTLKFLNSCNYISC